MLRFEFYKVIKRKSIWLIFGLFLLYVIFTSSEIFITGLPSHRAVTDTGETLFGEEGLQYNKNQIKKYQGALTNELIDQVLSDYENKEARDHVIEYFDRFWFENHSHMMIEDVYPNISSALTYGFSASWESFLFKRLQIMKLFPLILMIVFCSLFPYENQCGMSSMLLTTKNGRIKTGRAKILIAFLLTNIVFFMVSFLQTLFYLIRYGMEGFDTSIQVGFYSYFRLSTLPFHYGEFSLHTFLLNMLSINLLLLIILGVSVKSQNSIQALLISGLLCYGISPEFIAKIFNKTAAFYIISMHPLNSLDSRNLSNLDSISFIGKEIAWIHILQILYVFLMVIGMYVVYNVMIKKQNYFQE